MGSRFPAIAFALSLACPSAPGGVAPKAARRTAKSSVKSTRPRAREVWSFQLCVRTRSVVGGSRGWRADCLRTGGGSPCESNASWRDWVSGNAEGSVFTRRPSPCDYIRSSSRPSHTHRLLRSRRLPDSRTASWVSQGTSTEFSRRLVGVRIRNVVRGSRGKGRSPGPLALRLVTRPGT
jgi:hypothetical protein